VKLPTPLLSIIALILVRDRLTWLVPTNVKLPVAGEFWGVAGDSISGSTAVSLLDDDPPQAVHNTMEHPKIVPRNEWFISATPT
jgi:hypothetical protein